MDVTALLSARTGIGVFTAELLGRLARVDDLDLRAYAVTWRGRDRLRSVVPPGVGLARAPMAARPLRGAWARAERPPIEWWTGPVDLVHGPNFVVPPARRAARLVTVHDLTPLRFPELSTADTLQYPALLRRAIAAGAHVHTVSRFVAGEVIEFFGADPGRVHTVPNGVSAVAGGDPARGRARAGAERYVLFLGTVEPRKDLPVLVRAFDAVIDAVSGPRGDPRGGPRGDAGGDPGNGHDDLRLVIAGPDGWGVEALVAAVRSARHGDRVVRAGWVDDGARADLLAGASVFAYPSRYEGFGLPPLEAMAAGVPVVTTATGALPETVGDAAVLVAPGDADALAEALVRVLDDESFAATMVARGRAHWPRFSWDRCAADLADLYRHLGAC